MAHSFSSHYIITKDGAQLSYYSIGNGPGLIILHGSAGYALTHQELALQLSPFYTVYLPSRRCRGLSDPYPESVEKDGPLVEHEDSDIPDQNSHIRIGEKSYQETYRPSFKSSLLEVEISDLECFVASTGASYLIGVSTGALIILQSLLSAETLPWINQIQRIILFEPPLVCIDVHPSLDINGIGQYERDLASKGEVSALVTAMYTVQLGPTWIPRRIMDVLAWVGFTLAGRSGQGPKGPNGKDLGKCTLKDMAHIIRYDFAVVEGMIQESKNFQALNSHGQNLMLLQGEKTMEYMKEAMSILRKSAPNTTHLDIPGVGHELLVNSDMRGRPERAVPSIKEFFSSRASN
ncbi:hypothetical protein V2G26_010297 [Clonostachys chloroleuca]|uniref:AB hydrolase-1 domain-containing protein n=1 Tax=Clonostachys chloroleuca TaxID=1926264 RepID=A0AA35PU19_9HYPO|nr:unnamed protein product [Clonostachys chloroleuca]